MTIGCTGAFGSGPAGSLPFGSGSAVSVFEARQVALNAVLVTFAAAPASTTYYDQKVWDTGTGGWCYYTKTTIDPSPLSGEAVPNWTGSISTPAVLAERVV